MLRTLPLWLLCLVAPLSASGQCYQLVWADEFDGSSLDPGKWAFVTGPNPANNEPS